MGITDILKRLGIKKSFANEDEIERLRNDFRERYHHFKLLLNANNKALHIMSEIEEALHGNKPFGMTFVFSRLTGVATSVWQIIDHLNRLSSNRYKPLYGKFKEIHLRINPFLKEKKPVKDGPLVIPLEKVDKSYSDQVGGKMANLGEVGKQANINISQGFVITSRAYDRFMEENDLQTEINRRIQTSSSDEHNRIVILSGEIQRLILDSRIPEDVAQAINKQYSLMEKSLGRVSVAMRSSALGEDLLESSFAGQYRSELNVSPESILDAYKGIVASKYSSTAMIYRHERGIRDESIAMCVGCTRMIDAEAGGVIYSRNPMDFRDDSIVINSVWGLPKPVVDGTSSTDLFVVSRDQKMEIIHRDIPIKELEFVCYSEEGVCRLDMAGEKADKPSLKDELVIKLAEMTIQLEEYYGFPLDIEWAMEKCSIIVLQCRPLRQMETNKESRLLALGGDLEDPIISGGITASPGTASGPVYIVKKDIDILRFPEGAVLVASQALPRWASLLGRAIAVITEQGSLAGHLANVAREFNVPALFGIKDATTLLKDHDILTVDADGRKIHRGKLEGLQSIGSGRRNLMQGSPVYEALKGASRYVVPLSLLDPDSPQFKMENCLSFHDITRFSHEKSIEEMFNFGKDHEFPERSSKQLYINRPMKWWILNLDDGFKEESDGKYIRLENIASVPMLALWDGISAFPWEGPPPVDGRGFMSVMFQATQNTALVPGARSNYGEKNYFMISKNYCSLSSRLGFHFCITETMVSERKSENYLSFQFKGGAADEDRRIKRIQLVSEILEEHDFRTNVTGDNLVARIEGRERDFLLKRLRILGYLLIHTRQLDMVMAKDSSADYYRAKLRNDIERLE